MERAIIIGRLQDMTDKLIVAMDFPDAIMGLELARKLGDSVSFYKIGLGMLTGGGLALATELKQDHGKRIFLDLKLFDTADTVENAVFRLAQFDLDFLTVHGDPHIVRAAKLGAVDSKLKILAVTILTSLDRHDLDSNLMKKGPIHKLVVERADQAFEAGADGVISSPQEAACIRLLTSAKGKLIVTPGIRPEGTHANGQKRIGTPGEAIKNGADHIVVGRPILKASNPRQVALSITKDIQKALKSPFM